MDEKMKRRLRDLEQALELTVKALEYCTYERDGNYYCNYYEDFALDPVKVALQTAKEVIGK